MEQPKELPSGPPSPEDFFLVAGLYEEFPLNHKIGAHAAAVLQIEFYPGSLKTLCVRCGEASVFRTDRIQSAELTTPQRPHSVALADGKNTAYRQTLQAVRDCQPGSYNYAYSDHFFLVQFYCTRNFDHRICFAGTVQQMKLQKVGQYPSFGDLASAQVNRYRKLLGPERSREYTRAINLFSHDIGIGSLIYLRRILETLIEDAHGEARADKDWDEAAWPRMRVGERISALRAHLPSFLHENQSIYSILSMGVHELSEQECLAYFPVLRGAVDLILEEQLAHAEIDARRLEVAKALGDIREKIKNSSEPSPE